MEAPACFWFGRPPCPRCGKEHGDPEASDDKDLLLRMLYEKCVELGTAKRERDEALVAINEHKAALRRAYEIEEHDSHIWACHEELWETAEHGPTHNGICLLLGKASHFRDEAIKARKKAEAERDEARQALRGTALLLKKAVEQRDEALGGAKQ